MKSEKTVFRHLESAGRRAAPPRLHLYKNCKRCAMFGACGGLYFTGKFQLRFCEILKSKISTKQRGKFLIKKVLKSIGPTEYELPLQFANF